MQSRGRRCGVSGPPVLSSNGAALAMVRDIVNTGLAFHRAEVVLSGVMENFIPISEL
jgi:hypothetical protein